MPERASQHPGSPTKDPFLAALEAAEWDDEPLTDEDIAAMAGGESAVCCGDYVSLDELPRRMDREE